MKKQISLALAGAMALSLAACGGSAASTATSTSEAASTADTASSAASDEVAAEGDVLDQAAAAAFAQDVTLTMWGAEEDQDLLREISDKMCIRDSPAGPHELCAVRRRCADQEQPDRTF